jgi:serine/threonine-protein kinase
VRVPNVVGESRDRAVSQLTAAGLEPNVFRVPSLQPIDTVLATAPKAGVEVIVGTAVRVNVSSGPKPVAVPNVVGSAFESAQSALLGLGFAVAREDVENEAAAGIVVGQSPAAGTQAAKGSTVTLQVSQGPGTSQVPDVESQTQADAVAQLEESGFEAQVVEEIVDSQDLDGRVLSQDPEGGTELEQGSTVVIVVGRFEEIPPPEEPVPTTTDP